jgi:hypothetical protein
VPSRSGEAAGTGRAGSGHGAAPRRTAASCPREDTPPTAPRRTRAASAASPAGTSMRRPPAASARPIIPGTWRREPSRPSSPTNATPPTDEGGRPPEATSTPTAMGRSSPAPPFRTPDGARFTVIRRCGHASLLERMAARTRSRASRTSASGSPTTVKPGMPPETWTSTETERPVVPTRVAEGMMAIMTTPFTRTARSHRRSFGRCGTCRMVRRRIRNPWARRMNLGRDADASRHRREPRYRV